MDIQKKKTKRGASSKVTKVAPKSQQASEDVSPRTRALFLTFGTLWAIAFLFLTVGLLYNVAFAGSTFPGLKVSGHDVSGLTRAQLKKNIQGQVAKLDARKWQLVYKDKKFEATEDQMGLTIDGVATLNKAWRYGHNEGFLTNIYDQLRGIFFGNHVGIASSFSIDDFQYFVDNGLDGVSVAPQNADLAVDTEGIIHLTPSQSGQTIDSVLLRRQIQEKISADDASAVRIVTYVAAPTITNRIARASIQYVSRLLDSPYTFTYKSQTWTISPHDIRSWISTRPAAVLSGVAPSAMTSVKSPTTIAKVDATVTDSPVPPGASVALYIDAKGNIISQLANPTQEDLLPAIPSSGIQSIVANIDSTASATSLSDTASRILHIPAAPDDATHADAPIILAPVFDRVALNKTFDTISEGIDTAGQNVVLGIENGKVVVKAPSKNGRGIDREDAISKVVAAANEDTSKTIALVVDEIPADVTEASLAHLGINQKIGEGVSDFVGSTQSRIKNIKVAVARFQGALIKPGEELSFTGVLGPVTGATGYLPELVIKGNKITPEYGGGVCQVSTTLFRAAVNTGLQITRRQNHSFVVHYYGTPGMDATVYYPNPDFRFVNNTPAYILIQARIEGTKLYFDLYGTNDGRTVKTEGPYLYDKGPGGAVKASWTQIVSKDGVEVSRKTFNSNYKAVTGFTRTGFQN